MELVPCTGNVFWIVIKVLKLLHGTFSAGATFGILRFFNAMLRLFVNMSRWAWQSLSHVCPFKETMLNILVYRLDALF